MKVFENELVCGCGRRFAWKYIKLDSGEAFSARREVRMQNFKNYHETEFYHIIEIECPRCNKRHFVEIKK